MAILVFLSTQKTHFLEDLKSSILSTFVEFCSTVSNEKSKMSQLINGLGGFLCFLISSKITNLEEDVEVLLPV